MVAADRSDEAELRLSEQRFRNLVEGSIQGLVVLLDNVPVFANQAIADILGYEGPDHILGMSSADTILHPDEIERIAAYRDARLHGGEVPTVYEVQAVRKDGSTVWLEMRPTLVEWDQMPAIQVTYVDIDERKQALEALRQSEQKFRNMVEGSIQGLVVFGMDKPVFANQAMADILGYDSPDELLRIESVDQYVHPEYVKRLRASRAARLRGEQVMTLSEFKALRKDGSEIWLENRPTLVEWEGQLAMQSAYFDITERKTAEADAARAHQSKSDFLSLVSHELRTPLNAILGFGQLLRDYSETPLPEDQQAYVRHILEGGQHLLKLVNEILDLSRIESGNFELSIQSMDPAPAVRECITIVKPLADKRGITLSCTVGTTSEMRVSADPGRLKQVLLNLLSNAVKYNRLRGR